MGVTGSVAAIKVPELVQELRKVTEVQVTPAGTRCSSCCSPDFIARPRLFWARSYLGGLGFNEYYNNYYFYIQVVCTQAAQHFFNSSHLPSDVLCHQDKDEWVRAH